MAADHDLTSSPTREWDAATYDRVSEPMVRWAEPVLGRLRPDGVGVVLDAGCGTGRVTEHLLERLPQASVIAVDGSARMLDQAASRLSAQAAAGRVRLLLADLTRPLPLDAPVDAVVSTATFHWIADHDALFANLAAALRPGGQLVAQCGGAGNIASVVRALEAAGETWHPWHFATPDETARRLHAHGFTNVRAWVHAEPTPFPTRAALEEYLATVVLGAHLDRRPPDEQHALVQAVAAGLPGPVVDYVRLDIAATRGGG